MNKSLDFKLDKIRNGNYQNTDFIIADAKDGDMGGGVFAPGPMLDNPEKPKPYKAYLQAMQEMTDSGLVDIMLMSCLLYTSPSPRDKRQSRMPSSA